MLNGEVQHTVTQSGPLYGGGGVTMTTSFFSVRNSLQLMRYMLSPDYLLKERKGTSLGTSGMQTVQAGKRMLSHGPQETFGNLKGSLSRRWNGRNAMDYCVSRTASMFQMIQSYVVALHRNTIHQGCRPPWTLENPGAYLSELLVATDVEIHWSVYSDVRHLSPDEDPVTAPNRRAPSAPHSGELLGRPQHGLH
jgi:hypothetical protein